MKLRGYKELKVAKSVNKWINICDIYNTKQ